MKVVFGDPHIENRCARWSWTCSFPFLPQLMCCHLLSLAMRTSGKRSLERSWLCIVAAFVVGWQRGQLGRPRMPDVLYSDHLDQEAELNPPQSHWVLIPSLP